MSQPSIGTPAESRMEAIRKSRYSCQATELVESHHSPHLVGARSYVKDITSGNVRPAVMIRYLGIAAFNVLARFILRWICATAVVGASLSVHAWISKGEARPQRR